MPEDKESLSQRKARLAEQKSIEATELEKAKLLNFYAMAEHKKAEVAKQLGILHLVTEKYDTRCLMAKAAEGEQRAATTAAELERVQAPRATKEKAPTTSAAKKNVPNTKATKATEKKAKEALK